MVPVVLSIQPGQPTVWYPYKSNWSQNDISIIRYCFVAVDVYIPQVTELLKPKPYTITFKNFKKIKKKHGIKARKNTKIQNSNKTIVWWNNWRSTYFHWPDKLCLVWIGHMTSSGKCNQSEKAFKFHWIICRI